MQSSQQAQSLLDNMGFFSLSHTLLLYGQGEAVVMVMMRFVEAAAALGDAFFRWPNNPYTPPVLNSNMGLHTITLMFTLAFPLNSSFGKPRHCFKVVELC